MRLSHDPPLGAVAIQIGDTILNFAFVYFYYIIIIMCWSFVFSSDGDFLSTQLTWICAQDVIVNFVFFYVFFC